MKRFALLLILALVACQENPVSSPTPQIASATLTRSTSSCTLIPAGHYVQVRDHFSGTRWVWDTTIFFFTTSCASDLDAKVYYIFPGEQPEPGHFIPDGRRKPVGAAKAPEVSDNPFPYHPGALHAVTFQFVMPKDWGSYPDQWNIKFLVEVRAAGIKIGSFTVVDDGTPDLDLFGTTERRPVLRRTATSPAGIVSFDVTDPTYPGPAKSKGRPYSLQRR